MTQALQVIQDFTPEQMALITNTVARGASKDELQLFLYRCKNMGLDPLKPGRVHFIKYGNNPGSIVVGIEGFRTIAARTGKLSGINRGVLKDPSGVLIGAWCEIHRKDWTHPLREEVSFAEFTTGKNMWAKFPEQMIKKVAEATALRMAFPDDMGGVYEVAEMDRQEKAYKERGMMGQAIADGLISEEDANDYTFPAHMGKLGNAPLNRCSTEDLRALVNAIDKKYEGKNIPPKTLEAHENAIAEVVRREGGGSTQEDEPEWEQEPDTFKVVKKS